MPTHVTAKTRAEPNSPQQAVATLRKSIDSALEKDKVAILPPLDVKASQELMVRLGYRFDATILDPWYNKGFGGMQDGYQQFFLDVIREAGRQSTHVFFWGFPEIIAPFVERIPQPLELVCWLTWYYKNNPSVIRGWRAQRQLDLATDDN